MERLSLDVIIPVQDRQTVVECVAMLRAQASRATGFRLGQILLCDGGSREADCRSQLAQVAQWEGVKIYPCGSANAEATFNKGWLLNQGLAATTAPLVLISDVDILWNTESLDALAIAASQAPDHLYCVQSVVESQPSDRAVPFTRYAYRIGRDGEAGYHVEVYEALPSGPQRPGCGLVCARRSLFLAIGGYRHDFRGWGWEDQDLLMRAQLLGYGLGELGWVTHLSHGDQQRNADGEGRSPQESRDRNIRQCLQGLAQGQWLGDWQPRESVVQRLWPSPRISLDPRLGPWAIAELEENKMGEGRGA
jgi:glycosyltransferase involved in cell wall biosynthesis